MSAVQPSSRLLRTLEGVETEVVIQNYADRVLVLVTQLGKVGNLIQASIPATASLAPLSAESTQDNVPLVEPPPSIELIPLLGSPPSQHIATLHSLYASHIATLVWTLSSRSGDGERRCVITGLALKKHPAVDDDGASLSVGAQNTFKGVMEMIFELQNGRAHV
ncbi:hypothetical protein M0805_003432 [Coniferiporia weirii]|nr:hypothetical protein M0805_003432 [Coniferiporia weirii]